MPCFFSRLRQPPRSTLFPYTTLSDLPVAARGARRRQRLSRVAARPAGERRAAHRGGRRRQHVRRGRVPFGVRSEEHTSELQSQFHLVCRLLLEKKKKTNQTVA